ncbi:MAG: WecB/TagA/CpsF family glycosyltransferase, partial [Alicyclobacillaceae bacterium]|nr:WecB/TagA/CpsF family glycosyltransferase [Alicyclobacillaceae bacterium]
GVGGSFDVWGGTVPRAPQIFRKLNVEWLYRLLREPSRIRRQTALPRFAWRVVRQNQSYAPHKR